jgi:hypothetical protein
MNFNVFNDRMLSFLDKKENPSRQLAATGEWKLLLGKIFKNQFWTSNRLRFMQRKRC